MKAAAFVALLAASQAAKPVNSACPVKAGGGAKASITTTWKGYTIGFC
jgi:hypothetical protein